jgi:hypothetical protein
MKNAPHITAGSVVADPMEIIFIPVSVDLCEEDKEAGLKEVIFNAVSLCMPTLPGKLEVLRVVPRPILSDKAEFYWGIRPTVNNQYKQTVFIAWSTPDDFAVPPSTVLFDIEALFTGKDGGNNAICFSHTPGFDLENCVWSYGPGSEIMFDGEGAGADGYKKFYTEGCVSKKTRPGDVLQPNYWK